jgi:TolA-binding protein
MSCSRLWQAEAVEDGRIDALSAASFERHRLQCSECAHEASVLRALRDTLQRVEPREPSPLEQRRERAELLRRANQLMLARRDAPRRPLLLSAAAALVAVVTVSLAWRASHSASAASTTAPVFELRAVGGASFHDQSRGPSGRVTLTSGALAVHVEHLQRGQRFVVAVPDGELEVHGTRFIVEVEHAHTQRVLVTEGVVSLRLSGGAEHQLIAGSSWTRPPPSAPDSALLVDTRPADDAEKARQSTSAPPDAPRALAARADERAPTSAARLRRSHGATHARDTAEQSVSAASSGAAPAAIGGSNAPTASSAPLEFAAAMASFQTGAYLDADERFATFAARFAADPRSEDAAFLRAVIATKRGDAAAAVARARDYVKRFPSGLRSAEMQRLLNAPW